LAPFSQIEAGFCEDIGYQAIRTSVRCGLAAQALGITMNAHSESASQVAPGGCYQYTSNGVVSVRMNQDQAAKEYVSSSTLASLCQLPGSCVDYYVSYSDDDMVSGTSAATTSTWGDCMESCASNSACGVWSFDTTSSSCKLYNAGAAGSASTADNLISGPPFCQEVPGVPCQQDLAAATGWTNTTTDGAPCLAATVGRYVTIWTRKASDDMKVCEVEVRGGLAPRMPDTFYINSGCSGASVAGNFILNGNYLGFPVYHYPQEDVYEIETGKETASYTYDATAQRWVLSISSGPVAYAYTAAVMPEGALVMTAETGTSSASLKCQRPLVRPDPAESCSWRFGFSHRSKKYECRDGTICSEDDTDCCSSNGGVYRCPYDLPIMCETATSGLYTCSTDCSSLGNARKCQATDSSASSCFASGVSGIKYSTVMTDGTFTETSAEDCQMRCRTTGGCAHFSYYPTTTTDNCKLHDFLAVASAETGTTSGPPTCLASVTTVDNVNPDQIGFFRVYYLCTDSSGVSIGTSRVVEVGCEGPNPTGIYGGNIVTCDTVQSGPAQVADYLECLKICTADSVCETYEFLGFDGEDGGNCTTRSGCDGVYSEDTNTLRLVGYCQRINHYPKIFVTASDRTVNIGQTYAEGAVSCTDYEDPYPPDPTTVTSFDVNVAGEYVFYYTCKDQIGQETYGNRTVTVKANCSTLTGIANAADPPCLDSNGDGTGQATNGPFAHGDTCEPKCQDGYTRSRTLLTCTTQSDSDYQSDWDYGTFICGDSPCDISGVAASIKNLKEASTDTEVISACQEGDIIPSGATCTPNCKEGDDPTYVPTVTSLSCDRGNFTPVTYACNSVASVPQYVTYESRDVDAIVVTWAVGNPSDCEFTNWRLEYILTSSSSGQDAWTDWQENPNCPTTALEATARTSILSCEANTLEEGSGYKFRVREECSNTDLNGDWQTSEEITTTTLTPPVTIFTLPNSDVYDSPGSVMVAFDQAVVPGMDNRTVELIKFGDNCLPSDDGTYNYTKMASEMKTTSLEGASGMEIAGSRILIITPPEAYWAGSCTYNVSFQQASIYPDTTGTIKELAAFWYNFTYIEVPPSLQTLIRNDSATTETSVQYVILYDKRTQMNCTATPSDATECATKQETQALSPTASRRCESRNSTNDQIQELDEPMSFTIDDLYPNVEYFVVCSGWIPGKFWVPTVEIAATWATTQTVTTLEDTETGISNFQLTVYAECKDGTFHQIYTAAMLTSAFELGYTAQIDQWIEACQPGVSLELSESVNFTYAGTVWTTSANAYVKWDAGPNHTVTYTKPDDATESAVKTDYLKFTVQSLAYLQGNTIAANQEAFQVLATVVDIGFSWPAFEGTTTPYQMVSGLSSLAPLHNSTGAPLPTGYEELVLDVGAEMNFQIKVSQTDFDWNEVTLYLKSTGVGYLVTSTKLSEDGQVATFHFTLNGQGTQLPFILKWQTAIFVIPLWISFSPPVMSVTALTASLTAQTDIQASFTNVPSFGLLAFALPASTIQIYIVKNGYSDELCGATVFENTWSTGTCSLSPAALLDIIIYLEVHNHQLDQFLLVPGDQAAGLSNIISYAQPLPASMTSDMASAVRESGESSILDLGMIVNTFPAYIYIFGSAFPSLDGLGLKGAAVAGYKAELVYTGCDAVELCQSITWMNDTHLRCLTTSCLDITCFPRLPNVKLYLGDLVGSTELERSINFPRPIIQRFNPGTLEDVGLSRYVEFWGLYFSEQSCQSSHSESIQFVSNSTATEITLGEFAAPCVITVQNSTYLKCVISTKVRNVRDQSNTVSTVPPALLSHPESLTWNLLGSVYLPLNGDTAGVYASEIDPSTDTMWALTPLIFIVNLLTCDAGYRRESDYSHICIACEPGRWITTSETEWPLRCLPCAVGTYQDSEGASSCSSCPEFTTSPQGSDAVTHCTCLPGYFSPYYDDTTGKTTPGTPCTSCHNTDYMQDLSSDESCGDSGYNVGDLCTARDEDLCVNVATTTLDFRICKLYCPGGTEWPSAKRTFWHLRRSSTDSAVEGLDAYRPVIQRCLPTIACLPGNVCSREYEDVACSLCKFGWFMDASTGLCTECGEAQKIGMIVMAIVSVIGSFGCLVFFAFFMRFNADIVFKRDLLVAFQRYVLAPLKKSNFFAKAKRKSEARKAITIHKSQLGMSHSFSKYRELGMVFRVDESQIVHLAGLTKDSPLRGKVLPGWKVNTINGRRVKVRKEAEVQEIIQASRFPLRLTFSAPLKSKDQVKQESDGKSADGVNFDDDRKMIVVLLGVLTSFTKVSGFDFEWPDAFTELVKIAQMFSFNLNFFAPECSAETPYITKWIGYLVIPYFMIMPLSAAYIMACISTLPGLGPEAKATKRQLLTNAWARCICMVLLALLPFHLDTILIPFACISMGDGIFVLADVPSVQCATTDETFVTMFGAGCCAMMVFSTGFSWLIYCIWCSYQWQQGTRDRSNIPFYVAMVEVSTFGQRGYTAEVRTRVMENICAVRAFDVSFAKLHEREAKLRARDMLKGRNDREKHYVSKEEEKKKEDKSGELGQDGLQQRLAITKAKKRFLKKNVWPSKADGNIITYGWIFLVNTLLRNLLSNAAIKLTSNNLVVIGAGLQMLIFALNVTMLICLSPYKSRFVVKTESLLMTILFMILWCAVMKELLENHQDRALYEDIIVQVNFVITAFAFTLMFFVPFVPLYFAFQVMKKAGQLVTGPDAILNEIYMTAHMKKMRRRKDAEMAALNKLADNEVETDEKREMLASVGLIMPQLEATLRRFEEAGLGKYVLPEVQKKYMLRLGKLTTKINQERVLALEAERSREDAQQAAEKLAALQRQSASAEELEIARMQAEAAEVSAVKAETRLTMSRKTRQTQLLALPKGFGGASEVT